MFTHLLSSLWFVACAGSGPEVRDPPPAHASTPPPASGTTEPSVDCTPLACAPGQCGLVTDGCDGEVDCGGCEAPLTCGGGGEDGVCGAPCVPRVGAVLFDLGETLVTDQGALSVTRPGAIDLVTGLRSKGVPIGIITNTLPGWTEDDLRDILADPELLDRFDMVLLSSEASSPPKPDPAIYVEGHALLPNAPEIERTAFVTEELDHVADAAANPTLGARAAGLFGVWLSQEAPSPRADATVATLDAIATADWLACEEASAR